MGDLEIISRRQKRNGSYITKLRPPKTGRYDSMSYYFIENEPERNKPVLNYLSVLPGAGKTHWAINKILSNTPESGFISFYVAPTINLLKEVNKKLESKLKGSGRSIHFITSQDKVAFIKSSVRVQHELNATLPGDVFLITHKMYENLSQFPYELKMQICLIFDEASEFDIQQKEITLDYTAGRFFKRHAKAYLFLKDPDSFDYSKVIKNETVHPTISSELFMKYRRMSLSSNHLEKYKSTYGLDSMYKILELMNDKRYSVYALERKKRFCFFSFLSPDFAFDSISEVYLMSAFFELSELYHILSRNYVLIDRSSEINKKRAARIKENYRNIHIIPLTNSEKLLSSNLLKHYLSFPELKDEELEKADTALEKITESLTNNIQYKKEDIRSPRKYSYSANLMRVLDYTLNHEEKKRKSIDLVTLQEYRKEDYELRNPIIKLSMMAKKVASRINNSVTINKKPLLIINNFSMEHIKPWKIEEDFEIISVKSHGLNTYSDRNFLAFLIALNPVPTTKSFYLEFIPNYNAEKQRVAATALQALARLSVRKSRNSDPVYMVVYSDKTASLINETMKMYLGYDLNIQTIDSLYYNPNYIIPMQNTVGCMITGSERDLTSRKSKRKDYLKTKELGISKRTEDVFSEHESYAKLHREYIKISVYISREKDPQKKQDLIARKKELDVARAIEKFKLAKKYSYDYKPNIKTRTLLKQNGYDYG